MSLKTKALILVFVILAGSLAIVVDIIQDQRVALKESKSNEKTLLTEIKQYRTSDSLNVSTIGDLRLSLKDYKNYRPEDSKLIASLNLEISRLKEVVTTSSLTINKLKLALRDSTHKDEVTQKVDSLKCFSYADKYLSLSGCISKDSISIDSRSRESLVIARHTRPKKFLFIKLSERLFGYKEMALDVTSKNKKTVIDQVELVTIKH